MNSPAIPLLLRRYALRPDVRFWALQAMVWPAYGIALMMPWIGTYPIGTMLPNKVVIGSTGMLISGALREVYRITLSSRLRKEVMLLIALPASIVAGALWSIASGGLMGSSLAELARAQGALVSGIPQFGGVGYDALVMLAWSLAYLAWSSRGARAPETADRLILRDGRRSIVLAPGEIDWVSAKGDYVQVHAGNRLLLLRETISHLTRTLPPAHYVRIHRSALVNVARVREVRPLRNREYQVILLDGTQLRASRTYADRLHAALPLNGNHSAASPAPV